MYHVLLAVDGNRERSMAQTEAVAELPVDPGEMRVSILYSFTDNPSGASATQIASVRDAVDLLEEDGIETEVLEHSGDPAAEIVQTADDLDVDLICVGGRKRSPAGKALFGSVSQSVILNTERPVLVTGGPKEADAE